MGKRRDSMNVCFDEKFEFLFKKKMVLCGLPIPSNLTNFHCLNLLGLVLVALHDFV